MQRVGIAAAVDEIIPGTAEDAVGAPGPGQAVVTGAAVHGVLVGATQNRVVAAIAPDVDAAAGIGQIDPVIAAARTEIFDIGEVDGVKPAPAGPGPGAIAGTIGEGHILGAAEHHQVDARAALDAVGAAGIGAKEQEAVVAGAAVQTVGARPAFERVGIGGADDGVVSGTAGKIHPCPPGGALDPVVAGPGADGLKLAEVDPCQPVGGRRRARALPRAQRIGHALGHQDAELIRAGAPGDGVGPATLTHLEQVIAGAAGQAVRARAAVDGVVIAATGDGIVAAARGDAERCAGRRPVHRVIARSGLHQFHAVEAHACQPAGRGRRAGRLAGAIGHRPVVGAINLQGIVAGAAGHGICAVAIGIADDDGVVICAAIDVVRARTAKKRVIPGAAIQQVIAGTALDRVISGKPAQGVIATIAGDGIGVSGTVKRVIAGRAGDNGHGSISKWSRRDGGSYFRHKNPGRHISENCCYCTDYLANQAIHIAQFLRKPCRSVKWDDALNA